MIIDRLKNSSFILEDLSPNEVKKDLQQMLADQKWNAVLEISRFLYRSGEYGKFLLKELYTESVTRTETNVDRIYVQDAIFKARHIDYPFFVQFMKSIHYGKTPIMLIARGGIVNGQWALRKENEEQEVIAEGYYNFRHNKLTEEDIKLLDKVYLPEVQKFFLDVDVRIARYTNPVITFSEPYNEEEPKESGLSTDGGDYGFWDVDILLNGVSIGTLHQTTSGFPYCQLSGQFTTCDVLTVEGVSFGEQGAFRVMVSKDVADNREYISLEEFMSML